jgi:hypothetical protein
MSKFSLSLITLVGTLAVFGHAGLAVAGEGDLKGGAMLDCSGLPCVDVTIASGAHLKMLIDTGNLRSILDQATARKLGLQLKPLVGRDGKVHPEYSTATLAGVRIGEGSLGDVTVLIMDLAPDIKKGDMPNADGLLTYTAFGSRLLRMDYKGHRVELSEVLTREAPCPKDCGTLSNPTFGEKGPPIVVSTGFSVNGKPLTVQIDTLYSGTMLIYPTSVDKLGLAAQQSSKTLRRFAFTDGGVQMIQGSAGSEAFGGTTLAQNCPLYFATPDVHAPDGMFDGTVGHELFVGHVLTFDFFGHHFWMS